MNGNAKPPAIACTICDRQFDGMDRLTDHLEDSHGVINRTVLRHARPVKQGASAAVGDD